MERRAYTSLRLYVGRQLACRYCFRRFVVGEVITVTDHGRDAFCLTDLARGGCMEDYACLGPHPERAVIGEPMVYQAYHASGRATAVPARPNPLAVIALLLLAGVVAVSAICFVFGLISP